MSDAPLDQACGRHATGYSTGKGTSSRLKPQYSSGKRAMEKWDPARISWLINFIASLSNPYMRSPCAISALSCGQTVPVW